MSDAEIWMQFAITKTKTLDRYRDEYAENSKDTVKFADYNSSGFRVSKDPNKMMALNELDNFVLANTNSLDLALSKAKKVATVSSDIPEQQTIGPVP